MDKDEDGKGRPGFAHAFLVENASADTTNGILQRLGVPRMEWL
ncbi:MAG: IS1595 family transposase, partial [Deltaproteobacteria bacterium]